MLEFMELHQQEANFFYLFLIMA